MIRILRACRRTVFVSLLLGVAVLTGPVATAATRKPGPLLVVDYHLISKTPVSNSKLYDYVYRVDVKNATADTLFNVVGSVSSKRKSVRILDGQASFGSIDAQKVKPSSDTIAIRAHKHFDRRLDRKVNRGGRLEFEEEGVDPEDAGIPGWPAKWASLIQDVLDDLFRLKGTRVFDWTFTFSKDQGGPVITGQSPAGNVASDRPVIRASYQDPSGIKTSSVKLAVDGADVTPNSQVTASGVSFTPAAALAQGSHGVTLTVADTGGIASSATWSFSVDSLAPVVSGQSPRDTPSASPRSTISAQFADSGTGIDVGKTVLIVDDQDVTVQATVTTTGVTYTPPTALSNGAHGVTLRVVDQVGNQTEAGWSFGVDGTGPDITETSPKDVTLAADARPTVAATFADTGAGVDVASARMFLDGVDVTASAQVTAGGVSYSPALPLAERLHAVRVTVQDLSGNASEAQWGFTTRTDPEITDPSPTDTIVGAGAPVVVAAQYRDVGSGIDTAAVRLLVDDADVTSRSQVGAAGIAFTPDPALAEGLHIVTLTAADRAGHATSRTWRFTTDTGVPVVTGSSPKNELMASATPAIAATYQDAPGGAGIDVAEVRLSVDGVDVTAHAQVTATQVTYTPSAALGGGTHTVTVRVVDFARNAVDVSWSFQVDADGPEISGQAPADTTLPADALPQVTAQFEDRGPAGIDPQSVRLVVDGADVTAQATLEAGRITWSAPEALAEGPHAAELRVADALGNAATKAWQFTTSTPPVILDPLPKDFYLSERSTPTISAGFTDVGSGIDPGRTALAVDGIDVTGQAMLEDGRIVYAAPALGAGAHVVRLTVYDRSGNRTEQEWDFGIATAPRITSLSPEGTLPPESVPVIRGTYEDAGGAIDPARVKLSVDGVNVTDQAVLTPTSIEYVPAPPLTAGAHVATLSIVNSHALMTAESRHFEIEALPIYSLEVVSPAPGLTTTSRTIEVQAVAFSDRADVSAVSIGDEPVLPEPTGTQAIPFSRVVTLRPGDNVITVRATFTDGQSRATSVAVTYDAPPLVTFVNPSDLETLGAAGATSPRDLTGNVERPVAITGTVSKPVSSVTVNQQQAVVAGQQWRFDQFFLHEGTNLVTAVATDMAGATGSASVTLFVDQTAPLVTIEGPTTDAVTSSDRTDVRGIVNDAVQGDVQAPNPTVKVTNAANDRSVIARVSDRFFMAEDLPLEVGINAVSVTATDHVGNARTQEIRLSRVAVGSSRLTIIAGNRQRGPVNGRLTKPLTVLAIDRNGNPLADLPIAFDVTRGTGVLEAAPGSLTSRRNLVVNTDASGTAKVQLTLGKQSGEAGNMVRASHPDIAEDAVFTATAERGLPALVQAEGSGAQYAEAGSQPLEALSVVVYDEERNPVPDATVTFTIEQGDAAFDGNAQTLVRTTDKGGRAIARPLLGPTLGTVRVSAKASAATSDGTSTASVTGGWFELIPLPPSDGPTTFGGIVLDHTGAPLTGVRLSIGRTNLSATTGVDGAFLFESDVPPGKLDLFVDGRMVTSASGQQYPSLHFAAVAVRGQRNSLPHAISLPPLLMAEARVVGGPEDVTLAIPGFEGFAMVVKANSVTFPDGSRVGPLVVSPVNLEKLPMVPPGGATTFMAPAWTIQPSGTRFDPPVEVHIPNSLALKPGETREVYQWDHDLATFVPMGRATVSEDGATLKTDAGSGVTKAGWGGGGGGPQTNCGTGKDPKCTDCQKLDSRTSGNCTVKFCAPDSSKGRAICDFEHNPDICGRCIGGQCGYIFAFDANDEDDCCGGNKMDPRDQYCCVELSSRQYKRVERGKKPAQVEVPVAKCKDRVQATDDPDFFKEICPLGASSNDGLTESGIPNKVVSRGSGEMDSCVDGCSVPRALTPIASLLTIIHEPGRINNQDPTQGGDPYTSSTTYYDGCYNHDLCYQTCSTDGNQGTANQATCDSNLRRDMLTKCAGAANAGRVIVTYLSNPDGFPIELRIPLQEACAHNAEVYYFVLSKVGFFAYNTRQKQYCDCCPKQ